MQIVLRAAATALALVLVPPPTGAGARTARLDAVVTPVTAAELGASYRPGCPVPPERLRRITMNHWDLAGEVRRGELIVHQDVVAPLVTVFGKAFAARFPIRRMRPVIEYGASDPASMAADNTSAFNCRSVTGDATRLSQHAHGDAVDINPLENPYVDRKGTVHPPDGVPFLDRGRAVPGMILPGDVLTTAFEAIGWQWGGRWSSAPDFQHFSANGR
ncbi:M15 family metallopeptidase [Streptomyces purpureus]|uniref:M15 family metallopeptidase n=1 Tax=Streptomyces purpureus TaxID=1951 RepID=UPI00037730A6|nr:M15 family metallopeptidase [Streptomyces purpureus]